ncbi:MAG: hydroxymethylglutaryl-CoA lyase [Bacteroidia bacterium]|nr:hydroxymethylglutaryl-CoA lyase [Bacteroidia bacterium]
MKELKIIECPRDAMQGIEHPIPTELKARYLNLLLKAGFDSLDFGSFVSPKAVPQLADTAEVLAQLDTSGPTKLSAIVANLRGAVDACKYPEIDYLGYPFSISETFQQKNTRRSITDSLELVKEIQELCVKSDKELIIYISMAFGNPFGDEWSPEVAEKWVGEMQDLGIRIINMSDTIGIADSGLIREMFSKLMNTFPEAELGAHFHSHPTTRIEKIDAAWKAGCKRFDVALQGYGGCPFAEDELVGNIATESLIAYCQTQEIESGLDMDVLAEAGNLVPQIFLPQV